ncbi:hypothetical protein ACJRO0_12210 [Acetobacter oryzifermentans]|uniref:hypothetical protein n=1 Tax=Acetobacter oryzifermentans TaxID=1633874 RepID=UPI0039BFED80
MDDKSMWRVVIAAVAITTVGGLYFYNQYKNGQPNLLNASQNEQVAPQHEGEPLIFSGNILPFTIIEAVRNYTNPSVPDAQISVMIEESGHMEDWAATAAYLVRLAEKNGAITGKVRVFLNNPWGDRSPTEYKNLADAYFDLRPEGERVGSGFDVFVAQEIAPKPLIAYDEYVNELAGAIPTGLSNEALDRLNKKQEEMARQFVVNRYQLPSSWQYQSKNTYMLSQDSIDGKHIGIVAIESKNDVNNMQDCLQSNNGTDLVRGCIRSGEFSYILPDEKRRPPINFKAHNLIASDITTSDTCENFIKFVDMHKKLSPADTSHNNVFLGTLIFSARVDADTIGNNYPRLLIGFLAQCHENPKLDITSAMRLAAEKAGMSIQE